MALVNHKERHRLIVEKALELFARMGYAKVSFLDISEATGIARTALYRYFKTKPELVIEIATKTSSSRPLPRIARA